MLIRHRGSSVHVALDPLLFGQSGRSGCRRGHDLVTAGLQEGQDGLFGPLWLIFACHGTGVDLLQEIGDGHDEN